MKRYLFLLIISSVLVFSGCTEEPELRKDDNKGHVNVPLTNEYVKPGIIRIKLTPEAEARFNPVATRSGVTTGVNSIDDFAAQLGATQIKRAFRHGGKHEGKMRKAGLHLWYDIYFDEKQPLTRAFSNMAGVPEVQVVEPIMKIRRIKDGNITPVSEEAARRLINTRNAGNGEIAKVESKFNDPLIKYQWHYHNEGLLRNSLPGADVNLLKAWEIETGKPQVIVAVIDGGIDWKHPDLAANMWINQAELNGATDTDDDGNGWVDDIHGFNFVTNKGEITGHEHGTHVAGTVAAVNNNGIGVAGVAGGNGSPNSGIRMMSCQVFQHNFETGEDETVKDEERGNAFIYAANNGAVIAQNSWEYAWTGSEGELMQSDKEGIDFFIEYAGTDEDGNQNGPMKGGIVIFATGNSDLNAKVLPASYEKVFSVASYAPDYKKATYSNYGPWVHVAAPGGEGDYEEGSQIFSTLREALYGFQSGTSMACPHVSGIAALVVSKFGVDESGNFKPFTNEQLKARLLASTNDAIRWFNPAARPMGKGYINAYKALAEPGQLAPDRVAQLRARWVFDKVTLSWNVTADGDAYNGKAYGYQLIVSEKDLYGADFNRLPPSIPVYTVLTGSKSFGEELTFELTTLEPGKEYYISIAAFDEDGNKSLSSTITGKLIPNRAPVIEGLPSTISLTKKEVKEITFDVNDIEGYNWQYEFVPGSPAATIGRSGNTLTLKIDANLIAPGDYTASLTVTDEQGASNTVEIQYSVINYAPQLKKNFESILFQKAGEERTYTLSDYFIDRDGDPIAYQAETTAAAVVTASENSGILTVTSTGTGTGVITLTATDGDASTRVTIDVTSRDSNRQVDLYPVPVKKDGILNIRMGENVEGTIDVALYTMGGTKAYETQAAIAPTAPASINIGSLKAGNYQIVIKYKKEEITRNITKL